MRCGARIVKWVRQQLALGRVVPELSEALAIPVGQLRSWLYAPRRFQAPDEPPKTAPMRPVQIVADTVRVLTACRSVAMR